MTEGRKGFSRKDAKTTTTERKEPKTQRRKDGKTQTRKDGKALPCFSSTHRGLVKPGLASDRFEKLGRVVACTVLEYQLYLFHVADVRGRIAIDHH
jgi:hypothetical protein